MADDPLSAALEEIRERQRFASDASMGFRQIDERQEALVNSCYGDVPRLLAAVDEVLKTAGEWEASSDARPLVRRGYAAEVFRAAIIRGLTREGSDGG